MTARQPIVPCPTCGQAVPWGEGSRWRPFCSERCRLIDLGEWLNEERRIPAAETDEDGAWPLPDDEDSARHH